jgi:hypothetical protein
MSSMGEKYLHKWIEGFLTNWKHMKNVQKHFQGEGWSKKRGEKRESTIVNSLRCQFVVIICFWVSVFLMYSNQKQFNYFLCKASHQEQLKGSSDIPGHRRKLSQWTTPSHVLHMMKIVDPCMLAAKSRAVVA